MSRKHVLCALLACAIIPWEMATAEEPVAPTPPPLKSRVSPPGGPGADATAPTFTLETQRTPEQQRAYELLETIAV